MTLPIQSDVSEKDSTKSIFSSAKSFFFGTLLSRISGLLRDMALAFFLGASPELASFMVAFRFSNLFRRLFGEGTMHAGFVPYFEALRVKDEVKASKFFRDLFFSFTLMLLFVVLALEVLFHFTNFFPISTNNREIIYFIKLMLPGLFFICLYSLNSSFLQCHRYYFLPAIAPAAFNVVWIIALFLFRDKTAYQAAILLSMFVVLAYFVQWLITMPRSFLLLFKHISINQWFKAKPFSFVIRKMIKPLTFGVLGVGAVQINSALDACFAKVADISGPAYLWYAIRLEQLPLSLFSISIASALLPPLSRAFESKDMKKYSNFLHVSIVKSLSLMLIATAFIFVIGSSAVNLIYGRGHFSDYAITQTLLCLWSYAIGLSFISISLILSNAFYAKKNYFLPMLGSILSVFLNILLNSYFVFYLQLGAASVALATSFSSCFNYLFLLRCLKKDMPSVLSIKTFKAGMKILVVCLITTISMLYISSYIYYEPSPLLLVDKTVDVMFPKSFLQQLWIFSSKTVIFFGVLIVVAYAFRSKEILSWLIKTKIKSENN